MVILLLSCAPAAEDSWSPWESDVAGDELGHPDFALVPLGEGEGTLTIINSTGEDIDGMAAWREGASSSSWFLSGPPPSTEMTVDLPVATWWITPVSESGGCTEMVADVVRGAAATVVVTEFPGDWDQGAWTCVVE